MKLYNSIYFALIGAVCAASCSINDIKPEGGSLLEEQLKETTTAAPERVDALFNGMYTKTGQPFSCGYTNRADDWGFPMLAYSTDAETADLVLPDTGLNWFSVCGTLESRNANYANPLIRYKVPYMTIADCNDVIKSYPPATEVTDPDILANIAQARAMRAYAYLSIVPYFQFKYVGNEDKPTIPYVDENTTDFTNNPRMSNREIYEKILADLNFAVENLEGFVRPDKSRIDQQVAYGLRARTYLNMEEWDKAAEDAEKAANGYIPASIEEASKPFLSDINEHNWIWGYDMTTDMVTNTMPYHFSGWGRSFSGDGYSAYGAVYACIFNNLYDIIPETDVRKGWWCNATGTKAYHIDGNGQEVDHLEGLSWKGHDGEDIYTLKLKDEKEPFTPYTNVKFGMTNNALGSTTNDEDFCYMRVEEMILIQAEATLKAGNEAKAKDILSSFIKTYRDPSYDVENPGITSGLANEIWFQRRIELWGEGLANNDVRRLCKPLVRSNSGKDSNWPDNFKFNLAPDDGWWLLRFPQSETDTNFGVVDNTEGSQPKTGNAPDLQDGVTNL